MESFGRSSTFFLFLVYAASVTLSGLCNAQNTSSASCPTSLGAFVLADGGCMCPVGQYFNNGECVKFEVKDKKKNVVSEHSEFSLRPYIDIEVFSDQSSVQKYFLTATIVLMFVWLIFATVVRTLPLGDGNKPGGGFIFKLRYGVSRLDRRYHRKHWLDEQKVLVKRRSELGGMCSVASYIFWIGLFMAFTYEQIGTNTSTLQTLKAPNGQEVQEFRNDLTFSFTFVGNLGCDQLRATNGSLAGTGVAQRSFLAAGVSTTACADSPRGPTLRFFCPACAPAFDDYFLTWELSDVPGRPAAVAGLEFAASSRIVNGSRTQESAVAGQIMGGSQGVLTPAAGGAVATLRGPQASVLSFQLLPRVLKQRDDLRLMQVIYHRFVPGSRLASAAELRRSVANASETMQLTVWVRILGEYIVESDTVENLNFLSYLARLGGVYSLAISLFYLLQLQVEIRFRFLAYDDKLNALLARVRFRKLNWKKLRCAAKLVWVIRHYKMLKERDVEEARLAQEGVLQRAEERARRRARRGLWGSSGAARDRETSEQGGAADVLLEGEEGGAHAHAPPAAANVAAPGVISGEMQVLRKRIGHTPPAETVLGEQRQVQQQGQTVPTVQDAELASIAIGDVPPASQLASPDSPLISATGNVVATPGPVVVPVLPYPTSGPQAGATGVHRRDSEGQGASPAPSTTQGDGSTRLGSLSSSLAALASQAPPEVPRLPGQVSAQGSDTRGSFGGLPAAFRAPAPAPAPIGHAQSASLHVVGQGSGRESGGVPAEDGAGSTAGKDTAGAALAGGSRPPGMFFSENFGHVGKIQHLPSDSQLARVGAGATPAQREREAAATLLRSTSDQVARPQGATAARKPPLGGLGFVSDITGFLSQAPRQMSTVLPNWPHVHIQSGRPVFHLRHKSQDDVSVEGPEDDGAGAEGRKAKKKKITKSSSVYGSNTNYRGMVVRQLRQPSWLSHSDYLPAVPDVVEDSKEGGEADDDDDDNVDLVDLYNHVVDMYDYNVRLRRDFLAFQTMIENTLQYFRPHSDL